MPSLNKSAAKPSVKIDNKSAPPPSFQLRGYLMKQKHGKCRAWLKRYFVLYGEELRYYKNEKDINALAVISLNHYSLKPDAQLPKPRNQKKLKYNTFCLVSDDETKFDWPDYFLQASSSEDKTVWVDSLQNRKSQSTTVLDKWLDRLNLHPQDEQTSSSHQPSFISSTLTKDLPKSSTSQVSVTSSTSCIHSPTQKHALKYFKSAESRNACTTRSSSISSGNSRSDFLPSRSSDISTKLLSSKMFSWTHSKSSNSSASSIAESLHTADANDSRLKNVCIALESPIIRPSEYNHGDDDDPSERILANQDFFLCK